MIKHNSTDLFAALWASADQLRSSMTADVYKDYLLGLIFYKNLSDKTLYKVVDLLENRAPASLEEAQDIYENCQKIGGEDWELLCVELRNDFGCVILPQYTFAAFYKEVNDSNFRLENLAQAFREVEQSQGSTYDGLFDDFNVSSKDLGSIPQERNIKVASLIKSLANINFSEYEEDALGDAYEYLISKFASESGKKAGEFYTPQPVSKLISKIVSIGKEKKDGFTIYDPCCGSGSLLLQIKHFIYKGSTKDEDYTRHIHFFGQENNNQTFNLARMNMMLHKVQAEFQHINKGDTLASDWPTNEPTNFDATVMNPPYSQNWNPVESMITDPRFARYEKLAPKSAADYAFLLHGFYHLKKDGVMGIVLPHGVLFRGSAEGVIRKHLIEDGSIYAVIGLPANIFYNTSIPTVVIILKKNNTNRDILFIDASKEFRKEKTRNILTDENIDKIFNAFVERKDIEKYAHLASYEEIEKNDFNLNIPRYVNTFEEEEPIDLAECFTELAKISEEEKTLNEELNKYFKELGLNFRIGEGD